jgi:hypothetical protein
MFVNLPTILASLTNIFQHFGIIVPLLRRPTPNYMELPASSAAELAPTHRCRFDVACQNPLLSRDYLSSLHDRSSDAQIRSRCEVG